MTDFDFKKADLNKNTLIEAAAGTGKTYTLEHLVQRILVENQHRISLPEILVVTYTEKATKELQERIRLKLSVFSQKVFSAGDSILGDWLQSLSNQFDMASIFTIHGFCSKMLAEFPFETESPPHYTLAEEDILIQKMAKDVLRKRIPSLSEQRLRAFRSEFDFVDSLISLMKKIYKTRVFSPSFMRNRQENDTLFPVRFFPSDELIQQNLSQENHEHFREILLKTRQDILDIHFPTDQIPSCALRANINRKTHNAKAADEFCRHLHDLSRATRLEQITEIASSSSWNRWNLSSLSRAVLKNKSLVLDPRFQTLLAAAENLSNAAGKWMHFNRALAWDTLYSMIREMHEKMHANRILEALMTYDDMIWNVYETLVLRKNQRFLHGIRKRFKVALIDEFQDTDRFQWEIFKTLFGDSPDHSLFLIGDPRQSIYRFRQADLDVYFSARKSVEKTAGLTTNYRSVPVLLDAINHLMDTGSLFRETEMPAGKILPPSEPHAPELMKDNQTVFPVEFFHLEESLSCSRATDAYLDFITDTITCLLEEKQNFQLKKPGQKPKKIQPQDIAVLMLKNEECSRCQTRLSLNGIPSVISRQTGLFQSKEARETLKLLKAMSSPKNDGWVRLALLTSFFSFSIPSIKNMSDNEIEHWQQYFFRKQEEFEYLPFSVLFKNILEEHQVLERQLMRPGGERSVVNMGHLLEKLNAIQRQEHLSLPELIQRFHSLEQHAPSDEDLMRVESEGNAVRIMTIHSSKGLQFPIVFIGGGFRTKTALPGPGSFYSEGNEKIYDFNSLKENAFDSPCDSWEKRKTESEKESRRLLYVALTRPESKLYLPYLPFNALPASLIHLLWDKEKQKVSGEKQTYPFLEDLPVDQKLFAVCKTSSCLNSAADADVPHPSEGLELKIKFPFFEKDFSLRCHSFTSFTGILHSRRQSDEEQITPFSEEQVQEKVSFADQQGSLIVQPDEKGIFSLPRNVQTGIFLHDVLEQFPFEVLKKYSREDEWKKDAPVYEKNVSLIADQLKKYKMDTGYAPIVLEMLWSVLKTRIKQLNASLSDIPNKKQEMEFLLAVKKGAAKRLNFSFEKEDPVSIQFDLAGDFIKGFMDLIFEFNGKWYLVDWKSNYLGGATEDYQEEQIRRSLEEHSYYLQYGLYTLGLMKIGEKHNPSFDYDKHFGGIFYLYIRGMKEGTSNGIYFHRPDENEISALAEQILPPM